LTERPLGEDRADHNPGEDEWASYSPEILHDTSFHS
jgi:hypothetical protein